jgi:hypothetical protein
MPWDVCMMIEDEGVLGLIDVATQRAMSLRPSRLVQCLDDSTMW